MRARKGVTEEGGGLLAEALVAIALLAVLATALLDVALAALDAEAREVARTEALRQLQSGSVVVGGGRGLTAEAFAQAVAPETGEGSGPARHVHVTLASDERSPEPNTCWPSTGPVLPDLVRIAALSSRTDGRDMVLPPIAAAGPFGARRPSTALDARLVIHLRDPAGSPLPDVPIVLAAGTADPSVAITGADGCVDIPVPGGGPVRVRLEADLRVVAGRELEDDGVVLDVPPNGLRATIQGQRVGTSTVQASAPPGALLPSSSVSASLRWGVLGQEATRPVGTGGTVAQRVVTLHLGVCPTTRSEGTVTRQHAPSDGGSLAVPLPTVRVEGVASSQGAWIVATRRTVCPGPGALHPELRWPGPHPDVVDIALPGGVWGITLETPTGGVVKGPLFVGAGPTDASVRFP